MCLLLSLPPDNMVNLSAWLSSQPFKTFHTESGVRLIFESVSVLMRLLLGHSESGTFSSLTVINLLTSGLFIFDTSLELPCHAVDTGYFQSTLWEITGVASSSFDNTVYGSSLPYEQSTSSRYFSWYMSNHHIIFKHGNSVEILISWFRLTFQLLVYCSSPNTSINMMASHTALQFIHFHFTTSEERNFHTYVRRQLLERHVLGLCNQNVKKYVRLCTRKSTSVGISQINTPNFNLFDFQNNSPIFLPAKFSRYTVYQEPITRRRIQLSIIAIECCLSNENQKRALIWSLAT